MVIVHQSLHPLTEELLMCFTVFIREDKEWDKGVQPVLSIVMDFLISENVKFVFILLYDSILSSWELSSLLIVISDLRQPFQYFLVLLSE